MAAEFDVIETVREKRASSGNTEISHAESSLYKRLAPFAAIALSRSSGSFKYVPREIYLPIPKDYVELVYQGYVPDESGDISVLIESNGTRADEAAPYGTYSHIIDIEDLEFRMVVGVCGAGIEYKDPGFHAPERASLDIVRSFHKFLDLVKPMTESENQADYWIYI